MQCRASCRGCGRLIALGDLRWSKETTSYDEYYTSQYYYHINCLSPPVRVGAVRGFATLPPADQARARARLIADPVPAAAAAAARGRAGPAGRGRGGARR